MSEKLTAVSEELIIEHMPDLKRPVFIVGFEGWANGGNVAIGMIDYIIKKLGATRFAEIHPDRFYRFDDSRPVVRVEGGQLKEVSPPEAAFYAARQEKTDVSLVLLRASEPQLRWFSFVELLLSVCRQFGSDLIVSLGGMQDNVVHTDAVISGLASSPELIERLKDNEIIPADYEGPGAIHSLLMQEAKRVGIEGISLWGHSPFYLQGTHLLLLYRMSTILADLTGLDVDTSELEKGWVQLARQIQHYVDSNPELQKVIEEIVKSKAESEPPRPVEKNGNVIYLDDVFKPKG